MIDYLDKLDKELFLWLNSFHSDTSDIFWQFITEKETWFPFYALILAYIFWQYKWRGFIVLIGVALTITFADQFSSGFCKPFFERFRPCASPEIGHLVHTTRDGCGGYGFISGHSSNSFAIAMFIYLLFKDRLKYLWLLFAWAAIVAYSRIAVGVHYPGDITVGAIAGIFWGWLAYKIYLLADKYIRPKKKTTAS
ncbi:phosphatase PAP2 family protein [Flammeovirgaceae bacterium SG7u.111]|nr:phosphatase PAP2 family protein [Flammeovirgaceae bacterium SG7u.132]WPO37306.1 phosphatase PAP2 family protein [Flammeovirgaceae bacterium SG7u.111]